MSDIYTLELFNSLKRGSGYISNITDLASNWKRSIRRIGGFWMASFDYNGSPDEMDDLFFDGLMKEVRETSGGVLAWQGFIGDMVYQRGSITWRRSVQEISNAIKCLYTRQFSNMLSNGGAESGAWPADDVDVVSTQSTAWVTEGTYSCHVDIHSGATHGVTIQANVPIVEQTIYNFSVVINQTTNQEVLVKIQRSGTGQKVAAQLTPHEIGIYTINLTIPDTNPYTGNVDIRITNNPATQTHAVFYGDGAILTQAPTASDTGWIVDANSVSEFGRLEETLTDGALSGDAATARVATLLKRKAWPRLLAPEDFSTEESPAYKLSVVCYGYVFTLPWIYNTDFSQSTMSAYVTSLSTGRDYIALSSVDTNSTAFTADNRYPITIWQVLKNIVTAGDAAGNLWALGVYANRVLIYEQFSSAIAYNYRDGRLYNPAGGEMEAWLALPGWALLSDAPLIPYQTSDAMDDPRRIIVEEVEYVAPDKLNFRSKVLD